MTDQARCSKNKGLMVAILILLTAASPITGSAQADHDTDSDGNFTGTTVKIGLLGDMTSPAISALWDAFVTAADIATDHLNEEAGQKLHECDVEGRKPAMEVPVLPGVRQEHHHLQGVLDLRVYHQVHDEGAH